MDKHSVRIVEKALASYASREGIAYIMNEYWGKKVGPRRERQSKLVRDLLQHIVQPKTIVDVGCGPGHSADGVDGFSYFLGLDSSPYFIEYAQDAYKEDERYRFVEWDLLKDKSIDNQHFDICICNFLAEHSTDPTACYDILMQTVNSRKYLLSFLTNTEQDERSSYSHGTLIGESEMMAWLSRFRHWLWPVGDLSKEGIGVPAISWFAVVLSG